MYTNIDIRISSTYIYIIYTHTFAYRQMYIHIHICVYIYKYIYIYTCTYLILVYLVAGTLVAKASLGCPGGCLGDGATRVQRPIAAVVGLRRPLPGKPLCVRLHLSPNDYQHRFEICTDMYCTSLYAYVCILTEGNVDGTTR